MYKTQYYIDIKQRTLKELIFVAFRGFAQGNFCTGTNFHVFLQLQL